MNREILFRGRKRGGAEWFEGDLSYLVHDKRECYIFPADGYNSPDWYEVDPATVGQYIGMKDRNKERLFEGDIIRFKTWKDGTLCWVGVISFDYCSFIAKGGPNKESDCPFELQMSGINDTWCERIGNVYDNPELLKDGH